MALEFKQAKRIGMHYDLAIEAVNCIRRGKFFLKGKKERDYENNLVAVLESSKKLKNNIIVKIYENQPETVTPSKLFGFKNYPDITIGNDGTAIELKVIRNSQSIRELLGQAICYRMNYRFAILVIVSPEYPEIFSLCSDRKTHEYRFLKSLANEYNVFSVVGPGPKGENIIFKS